MRDILEKIYNNCKENTGGKVADYIPELANQDPEKFGISFCSIDGEIINLGDYNQFFCLQSCSKPLTYCLARMKNDDVHEHVSYEPSGRAFNSQVLNRDGLPHNPMINAGAIMVASMIDSDKEPSYRFNEIKKFYEDLSGNVERLNFDNAIYLSEQHHADRNIALAYSMRESKAFKESPTPSDIQNYLNLYFQACSLTLTTNIGCIIAATLAKGGMNPITNKKVVDIDIVRDCLSLMYQCGMYDFSGQFAFEIGLPAKSGVSGGLFLVVPNVGGFCIWSPRLDEMGNSVRGIDFCQQFIRENNYSYHIFHSITYNTNSLDETGLIQKAITAASTNDLNTLKNIEQTVDFNKGDYDGRTPLHLAVGEGHYEIVEYLMQQGVDKTLKDRWGNTAYDDALRVTQMIISSEDKTEYNKMCELLKD